MTVLRTALTYAFLLLAVPALGREPVTATVSACFTPPESCADLIVAALDGAKRTIRVQAYMRPRLHGV